MDNMSDEAKGVPTVGPVCEPCTHSVHEACTGCRGCGCWKSAVAGAAQSKVALPDPKTYKGAP